MHFDQKNTHSFLEFLKITIVTLTYTGYRIRIYFVKKLIPTTMIKLNVKPPGPLSRIFDMANVRTNHILMQVLNKLRQYLNYFPNWCSKNLKISVGVTCRHATVEVILSKF